MTSLTLRSNFYKYPTQLWYTREILTTLSDKRRSVCNEELGIAFFEAEVLTQTDYYPFGAVIPDRQWSAGAEGYRYGFSGHEKLEEVSGSGNTVDMGDRWLDVRLGRTPKIDAKASKYPALSPYSYAANNPIFFIDPDGKVIKVHYVEGGVSKYYTYTPGIKPTTNNTFVQQVHEAVTEVMKNDANKTFQNISASKETVIFNEIKTHDDAAHGTVNATGIKVENVSIDWNPTTGLQTTTGGALTPATALLHEAAHAERYINADTKAKVDALLNDLKPDGTPYDNPEEKRVIDNIETPYIQATNKNQPFSIFVTPQQQGTRTDHRGTTYTTTGVNSVEPANGSTVSGQSRSTGMDKKLIAEPDNTRVAKPVVVPIR